eukprot:CAMPEP_0194280960 /NCGR_PEP_ID=MMETSP0169-20130528/19322_1 /TAXON_ID=218684 /ORGANISM="Corethron pennatum, Strain L29A3" /LENGTH=115 /DNA_ID=CAMNT_0039025869 /DNA_START=105 /DNA_END=449 /DNA_ORIENTATION=+
MQRIILLLLSVLLLLSTSDGRLQKASVSAEHGGRARDTLDEVPSDDQPWEGGTFRSDEGGSSARSLGFDWVEERAADLGDTVGDTADDVGGFFGNMFDAIGDFFGNIGDAFGDFW